MKSFFKRLFHRTVVIGGDTYNYVSVLNSQKKEGKRSGEICHGLIKEVDFEQRKVYVLVTNRLTSVMSVFAFDQIVTISRMDDGRLRMWVKVKED